MSQKWQVDPRKDATRVARWHPGNTGEERRKLCMQEEREGGEQRMIVFLKGNLAYLHS